MSHALPHLQQRSSLPEFRTILHHFLLIQHQITVHTYTQCKVGLRFVCVCSEPYSCVFLAKSDHFLDLTFTLWNWIYPFELYFAFAVLWSSKWCPQQSHKGGTMFPEEMRLIGWLERFLVPTLSRTAKKKGSRRTLCLLSGIMHNHSFSLLHRLHW